MSYIPTVCCKLRTLYYHRLQDRLCERILYGTLDAVDHIIQSKYHRMIVNGESFFSANIEQRIKWQFVLSGSSGCHIEIKF